MGIGPAVAIRDMAERTGMKPENADVVEINEAFAAQVIAVLKQMEKDGLGFDYEKLNPNGGSIALGHPVGATGARLVLTALNELKRSSGKRALVSMCIGGGQGGAAWFETI
ncbi:UNVERIFIED_CONTAM: hypothetical protein GTU68_012731 [Idotea baltica]|nr:hypothetical protein [Idotea baltica]